MSTRRRFIKSIAGALVASAMPKPILNIGEKPEIEVTFYEKAMQRRAKQWSEKIEKAMWAGNPILHHQDIPNPNKEL
jgi:hypothetical protein